MEDNQIVNQVIEKLNNEDMWFTQKTDPTWDEPSSYYKLDEYGEPTEATIKQIAKEVNSLVGDGAVDLDDAIQVWVDNATMEYKVAYTGTLVTKFKAKPVVDQIEAYESQALNENKKVESMYELDKNAEIKLGVCPYCGSKNIERDVKPEHIEYNDYVSYWWHCKDCGKDGLEVFSMDFIGHDLFRDDDANSETDFVGKTENKNVNFNNCTKDKKLEDYKRRLKEENNKSANLISDMFKAPEFDADSKAGQIVMRTSELFNALSGKGYDVQVAFDNGESTSAILLGQQGGQVLITITDNNQPLRAFTSGNFEINDDNMKILDDIQNEIKTL